MGEGMRFAVGITVYNGSFRVKHLLESIHRYCSHARELEILVSDDHSPDAEETKKVCIEAGAQFTQPQEWVQCNGNINHLMNSLDANWIAVIQDDTLISRNSFEVMEKFLEDNRWLKLGGVGWMYMQAWELAQLGYIKDRNGFYGERIEFPKWNTGTIKRNAKQIIKQHDGIAMDDPIHSHPFLKPVLADTPSGAAFALNKLAWEDSGGMFEFGIMEGGMFFEMWDRGWINMIIPTPPILHGHGWSTDRIAELVAHYSEHPEKQPGRHLVGDQLYKTLRTRYYLQDEEYIKNTYLTPYEKEILSLVKYDFDAGDF